MARDITVFFTKNGRTYDVALELDDSKPLSVLKQKAMELLRLEYPAALAGVTREAVGFAFLSAANAALLATDPDVPGEPGEFVATDLIGAAFAARPGLVLVKERAGERPAAPWAAPRRSPLSSAHALAALPLPLSLAGGAADAAAAGECLHLLHGMRDGALG